MKIMKKLLKIRFDSKEAFYEDGKIYASFLPKPIIVSNEFDDGSYLGYYENKKVYLKKAPQGDYYTNLFGKQIDPFCFVSEELDTVFCLVSRNANTSIVLSALVAEGDVSLSDYPNEKFLWHDEEILSKCKTKGKWKPLSEICVKNYKRRIIVLDDPYKRYIRSLNKILVEPSLLKVDEKLKKVGKEKEFIDEMLYFSDLCENDEHFIWERHLGLQSSYVQKCREKGTWEVIKLSDLSQWWKDNIGKEMVNNNVSTPQQRRLSLESFDPSQRKKLDDYLSKDVELWNSVQNNNILKKL